MTLKIVITDSETREEQLESLKEQLASAKSRLVSRLSAKSAKRKGTKFTC